MSTDHAHTGSGELYYECGPCGYAAPATVAIGLCPHCGETLTETSPFA